jgi:putative DNA primase/helicase
VPTVVRKIVIFADADGAGRSAAARATSHYAHEGKRVEVRLPPDGCKDWNDALLSQRRAA